MNGDDFARFAYLALLLVAVGGWVIAANRGQWNKALQQAAIWGFIFLGMIAGYGLWNDVQQEVAPKVAVFGERIEIPQDYDGHFTLTLQLNGIPVDFMVDTGASEMVLTDRDARRIGLDPDALQFTGQAMTANGMVRTARVRIDRVEIGAIRDTGFPASITEGEMRESLLGMTYLQRFSRIEISRGRMILER